MRAGVRAGVRVRVRARARVRVRVRVGVKRRALGLKLLATAGPYFLLTMA